MFWPFSKARRAVAAILACVTLVIASCGGGGSSESSGTTYSSVAMAGELIDYTIDTANLTYSYTIVESQFGLTGRTGSGTLTRNGDGSYSPSGIPNARIVVLPNGLLVGAVRERFGASVITVPIIGLNNPVTTTTELAATYNYMHRACLAAVCAGNHGTFAIAANGTWSSCPAANLGAGTCPANGRTGTLNSLGGGRWQVMEGAANVGTAIGFKSAGQNVLLIDLKDLRAGGLGVGIVVGAQQAPIDTAQTDGVWVAGSSSGNWAAFTATGTTINVTLLDGVPVNATTSFTPNSPWTGLATTAAGGVGFLAGTGVYVLETANGYAELGVKIR